MNRGDLQRLSNARIREAKILFDAGEYSGAYYLSGYAIECALKACYAKTVKRHDFPDKKDSGRIFTHDFRLLIVLAKLGSDLALAQQASPAFSSGWNKVCEWNESSRYETRSREQAETLLDGILRRQDGVLPWIKRYW